MNYRAVAGLVFIYGLCFLMSRAKKDISGRLIFASLGLQLICPFIFFRIPLLTTVLSGINSIVLTLDKVTTKAASFLFGYLGGGPAPFAVVDEGSMFIVVFRVLPLIIVVAALSNALYYIGLIPLFIRGLGRLLSKSMKLGGTLSFGAAASVFFGTIETPLLIRPVLGSMNRSDLFALICCTMSTIAGTVMILYANLLKDLPGGGLVHLSVASFMSLPAALGMAKILMPSESNDGPDNPESTERDLGIIDAMLRGVREGTQMILQIVGVLLLSFALIYLVEEFLSCFTFIPDHYQKPEHLIALILRPLLWIAGIDWGESKLASEIFATKMILNEFVAYLKISGLSPDELSMSSKTILIYACCGFANIGSLGIVAGGLGVLMPKRQKELNLMTFQAVLVGNLATLSTAMVIGLCYPFLDF